MAESPAPCHDVMMTEDMFRKVRPRQCVDFGNFPFSPNDVYQPNQYFTEEQNKALEAYENGVRAKEYKSIMKRERKKLDRSSNVRIEHNKTIVFD